MVPLIVAGVYLMHHEAAEVGQNDTVIVQQQYLDMSSKFNHVCKVTIFL